MYQACEKHIFLVLWVWIKEYIFFITLKWLLDKQVWMCTELNWMTSNIRLSEQGNEHVASSNVRSYQTTLRRTPESDLHKYCRKIFTKYLAQLYDCLCYRKLLHCGLRCKWFIISAAFSVLTKCRRLYLSHTGRVTSLFDERRRKR